MQANRSRQHGYTLIELMTTLMIVGTLAAISVPAYSDYKRRGDISGSISLLEPTRISISEEVLMNTASSSGGAGPDQAMDQAMDPAMSNPEPQPQASQAVMPIEAAQIIARNPSPQVKSIVRQGAILVINYTKALDPDGETEYSLVMSGQLVKNQMQWTCKAGAAAEADLASVESGGGMVGPALPARWAPAKCLS